MEPEIAQAVNALTRSQVNTETIDRDIKQLRGEIEGRLIFTPQTDEQGQAYVITASASLEGLASANTLANLASPRGMEDFFRLRGGARRAA